MMKVKKIRLIRPECEVVFLKRKFICRLFLALNFPRLIIIRRTKFRVEFRNVIPEYSGTIRTFNVWYICIPKIKVVKSE